MSKIDGVIGSDMPIFTIVDTPDERATAADVLIESGPRKREATELSGHLSRTPIIRYECFRASARTKLRQVFAEKYLLMLSFPFK
jgi:hypothetical protein